MHKNCKAMCKFSESTKEKLGNALIYVAERVQDLSKTKVLKLLYLMEERMVLRYHVPFLGIPFEVWQAGPVAKDVFIDLSDGPYRKIISRRNLSMAVHISALTDLSAMMSFRNAN